MTEQQLRENVAQVRRRMEDAAARAGRDPKEILLCAASKTQDAATVRLAAEMEKRISRVVPPRRYQPYLDRLLQSGARVASIQTVIHCREVGLPRRGAHQMLRDICADPQLQTVLRRYPYWELPRMQAVFAFAMRWQLTGVEQLLVTLREKLGAKR